MHRYTMTMMWYTILLNMIFVWRASKPLGLADPPQQTCLCQSLDARSPFSSPMTSLSSRVWRFCHGFAGF
jgi:hypothetical protein